MAESVRRIVIRIINPRLFNRYQILAWYTDHLFTNCKIEDFDNEDFQVLDLLTYDEHEQSNDIDDSKFSEYRLITRINKKDPYAAIHSRHRLQNNRTENERLFQLTLKTEILTVMDKIKVAILVDSNFSMKTGDFRIHAAVAYETICKTIKGLKRPFQFTNSVTGQSIVLTPKVLVSVVAENQESDLIPLRSYLHNQEITEENTMSVFESLYLEMIEHETDLINLQGRYDSNLLVNSTLDAEQIDNIIDYGLYSLNMMSPDFCPILLYLTDGVSSTFGENIGRKTCQTCIREFVQFAVIQVGFGKGFTPTSSLGFVPNQIELRFLAAALNGF